MAIEFGPFVLDTDQRVLLRDGAPVPLTPKAFDVLLVLVEARHRVVEKAELMSRLWPATAVEDSNLAQQVFTLRKALGDRDGNRFIRTVPRHGYQFVAAVRATEAPAGPSGVATSIPPTSRASGSRGGGRASGRWVRASAAVAVLLALGASVDARRGLREGAEPVSVAVLPLREEPAGEDSEYLSDGMTEGLIRELGSVPGLRVLGRDSAFAYKDAPSAQAAGRALDVDAVLTGGVATRGQGVEVNAALLAVSDGRTLWRGRYTVAVPALPALQRTIRNQVALRLARAPSRPGGAQRMVDEEVYRLCLQGRYFWNKRTREGLERSLVLFREALRRDPDYAEAWSGLADAYNVLPEYADTTEAEAYPAAHHAATRALALDPDLAAAHASLAFVSFWWGRDAERSVASFEHALRLHPGYATAHHWYGNVLLSLGRVDEALLQMEQAQRSDPLSLIVGAERGSVLYHARRFDEAADVLTRTLEMDGGFREARFWLARTRLAQGRLAEALEECRLARALYDRPDAMLAERGVALARAGRREEARADLRELEALSETRPVAYRLAVLYAGLGEKARALDALERAALERASDLSFIGSDPLFDVLRPDERFDDLQAALRHPERGYLLRASSGESKL